MPPLNKDPQSSSAASIDARDLVEQFLHRLRFTQAVPWSLASPYDHYVALCRAIRDQIVDRMLATQTAYREQDSKRVYYLSMEYLLGRQLRNSLVCLGIYDALKQPLAEMGIELDKICQVEPDAGLGNGGLGRLAACYLDSAATQGLPVYGYGIRYEYGIFEQTIDNGWQIERPDGWLRFGSPWEIARPEYACPVRMGGYVGQRTDSQGRSLPAWMGYRTVIAVPYDFPIVAYGGNTVNLLRLWSAKASESFDLEAFNRGGYIEAVREQALSETITKVLYPNDSTDAGRELRLTQQYFFVASTLSDIIRRYETVHDNFDAFPDKVAIQLNDTHPTLAIAELMRILMDERGLPWERAWEMTRATFAYTNHTLQPEALEQWPVPVMSRLLPRHIQIIFGINQRFLDNEVLKRWPGDMERMQRMSLIGESGVQQVRMAHLAMVGSHRVNGVAALHTDLIRSRLAPDFAELWPERFINVTNGVTPRRWLLSCNPQLAQVITSRIGDGWVRDLSRLRALENLADDPEFQRQIQAVKAANKQRMAEWLGARLGVRVHVEAMFDTQVKRLHEYKRQLLNAIAVVMRYQRLCDDPGADLPARVVIFAAKAAPAYLRAKLIIKLIYEIGRAINADPRVGDRLKVLFLPNYGVSMAEMVIPATDLSEQISTAGTEASGTGNMKFAMNGALTIGTLDGANIEIRDAVGAENFFLFGLTAEQVAERRRDYDPTSIYQNNPAIRRAVDAIVHGQFTPQEPTLFREILEWLTTGGDPYMLLADLESYLEAQRRADELWKNPAGWTRASILNIARIGHFSSDRSVKEYAEQIWHASPVSVEIQPWHVCVSEAKP